MMHESTRLQVLDSYLILDTFPQKEFDDITELASIICGTPIALITLVDAKRQWFKSKVGLELTETPREHAFCAYTIQSPEALTIIEDSHIDERFKTNPLVTGYPDMRFYAGAPLTTADGHALGSLCVIDHEPRTLTKEQQRALHLLGKSVMERLDLRKASIESQQQVRKSDQKFHTVTQQSPDFIAILNQNLEFTYVNKGQGNKSTGELLGGSSLEGIEPSFQEEFKQLCRNVLENGTQESVNLKLIHQADPDHWVTIQLAPLKEENNPFTSILLTSADITEKLKAEAREKENKAYYESLFFNNPNAVARLNLTGEIEDVNISSTAIYAYSREEIIGRHFMHFVHSSFYSAAEAAFVKARQGYAGTFEGQAVRKGGTSLEVMVTIIPVILDGQVTKLQVITQDITTEKQAQAVLQQQAEAQSSIFESVNEGFLSLDQHKQVTYLNKVAAGLLNHGKTDLLNRPLFDAYPSLKSSLFYQKCLEAEGTQTHLHFRETFPLSKISLDIDIYPTRSGLTVHFLDVTEKVSIREDFEKLYFVASRVNNGVLILHANSTIEWANDSFLQLIDKTLEEAKGHKLSELLGRENVNLDIVLAIGEKLKKGVPFSEEIEYISPTGHQFWLRADITPDLDEQGNTKQFFVLFSDFTRIKLAKEELQQQANALFLQNKDLQEFTYIVSHNLRAPVAKALGLSDMLLQLDKEVDTFDDCLRFLNTSVMQLDAVMKDLNTILSIREKKDVLVKEPVNLAEVLHQAWAELEELLEQCRGQVTLDIPEHYAILSNKAHLYTIFYNLLSNSVKFRSGNRDLRIRIKCFGSKERGTIISYSDNGSGFNREKAGANVFKLYKRFHSKPEGKGFGLFLVKTHVEAMGGRIDVNSQVEEGTSFLIYLQ